MEKTMLHNFDKKDLSDFPGHPVYPPSEDVYMHWFDEHKTTLDFADDLGGGNQLSSESDMPGTEQDDAQGKIGSEDEESNYYSLGGDNHHELKAARSF